MKALVVLAVLFSFGCSVDAIDVSRSNDLAHNTLCGWTRMYVETYDELSPGSCYHWNAPERAQSTLETDACDVELGERFWPGGSTVVVWAPLGATERSFSHTTIEPCPGSETQDLGSEN